MSQWQLKCVPVSEWVCKDLWDINHTVKSARIGPYPSVDNNVQRRTCDHADCSHCKDNKWCSAQMLVQIQIQKTLLVPRGQFKVYKKDCTRRFSVIHNLIILITTNRCYCLEVLWWYMLSVKGAQTQWEVLNSPEVLCDVCPLCSTHLRKFHWHSTSAKSVGSCCSL